MGHRRHVVVSFALVGAISGACGGHSGTTDIDANPEAPTGRCGNLMVEPGEDCDDGNMTTADCDKNCHFTCGNGVVDDTVGETCDTGIASGTGACPTSCDDGQACTTDVLSGSGCAVTCVHAAITTAADGDGCCRAGANANTDNDCTAMCGNGILETGESCDTGIVAGAGACPTSCDDAQSCTTDTLTNPGSCQAACTHTPITTPVNGDGCCPTGANHNTDTDCSVSCGNGIVETGETCDTAITTGSGKCPTTCNDNVACTSNVLSNPGTCTAACVFPPITMAINGDGCCPPGANANTDTDCSPVCGNGVKEAGEACDDGNQVNTDACSNTCTVNVVATAFRFSDLDLRDPHVYAPLPVFGCRDVTDSVPLNLAPSVNAQFQTNVQTDGDMNGLLDLSPVLVFRPLDQGPTASTPLSIYFADCTAPIATTACKPGVQAPILVTATNQTMGQCLTAITGTTHPYAPAISSPSAPCFVSTPATVNVTIAGISLPLHDARVAATYGGAPATQLVNGLLVGFVTKADADATILPSSIQIVGGHPLSYALPGGTGNCASFSDMDTDNGVAGWWFYLNFPATKVTWSEN